MMYWERCGKRCHGFLVHHIGLFFEKWRRLQKCWHQALWPLEGLDLGPEYKGVMIII
jgi:hypothetical protein